MRSPIIHLSENDCGLAKFVANNRVRNVVEKRRQAVNNQPMDPKTVLRRHVTGARGEVAAWRWLFPIDWNTSGLMSEPDLGDLIDVKAVERETDHLLLINTKKHPIHADWIYLLARGHRHPTWRMSGWIDGATALAHPEWIDSPEPDRPCFKVPNDRLEKIGELWNFVERWFPANRENVVDSDKESA